ncbi:restriction endonuclease subunit S [Enterobacter sp. RIT418]|nr:restriction endonuclease subunit S [Enterobacter sp. RIT 418]
MGSKWMKYRLGDIATFSYGKMPKKELIGLGKYVVFSGYKYTDNYPEKNLSVGDLIVVARGVGGTGDVKIANQDCYLTNLPIKIDLDDKIIRKEYFYYLFKQNTLRYLDSGSAQSQITINDLSNIEVVVPLPEAQDSVIEKLRNLDKKIIINTSINQTLEQMSQTLFKSWFVDFDPVIDNALDAGNPIPETLQSRAELRQKVCNSADFKPLPADIRVLFPAEFEETELGWVPKGWVTNRLEIILELAYGKALKKTERTNGDYPVYGSGGVDGTHNEYLVKGPGVIVGRKGTVGSLHWENKDFYPIDTVFFVKPKEYYSLAYCYQLLKTLGLENMNTDAAVPGLNRNNAYRLEVVTPTQSIIAKFTNIIQTIQHKMDSNHNETENLTALRDTLLPKLISGELPLEDLPNLVAQTEPA